MVSFDFLKGKPKWEIEQQRRGDHERRMVKLGYELSELKRREALLKRKLEIASLRMDTQELRPRPSLMNFRDLFRRMSISEVEERRSRVFKRQLTGTRRGAEIAGLRGYTQKFGPKPTQPAGPPNYGKIMDALNFNPFDPPKKE